MKKFLFAPLFTLLVAVSPASQADTIGVWAGAGIWDWDVSGSIRYQSTNFNDDINVEGPGSGSNYLNWADDDSQTIFAIIEHPVPVIPNVKLFRTSLETSGNGSATVTFGGASLTGNVTSSLDMDQTDITAYWQLWDTVVGIDLGINAKIIDGSITVTNDADSSTDTANFDVTLPMLYAGLEVKLPLTGLTVAANASYIGYDGSEITDLQAYIRYDSPLVLGVEAGIKQFRLELDDIDDSYGELQFEGVYAMLYAHF